MPGLYPVDLRHRRPCGRPAHRSSALLNFGTDGQDENIRAQVKLGSKNDSPGPPKEASVAIRALSFLLPLHVQLTR
jgi:hypothetical protein